MSSDLVVDIVVVGGGTSGCVVAGRLAATDPELKILVIEAGPQTHDDPAHTQPAVFERHLFPDTKTLRFVEGQPSEVLGGRFITVPTAQCVGGGSAVNLMMYTRPAASDYDDWENIHGNPGWGYKDILPFLKKCETYQVTPGLETHGYSGPLKVSSGGIIGNVGEDFLEVGAKYDKSRGFTDDVNGLVSGTNQYGYWPKWISGDNGSRSDTAHSYIYNQSHNQNLVVLSGYLVKRVIFEDKRAVGVEFLPNARYRPTEPSHIKVARATRLVVISAGALGSPLILERSGIGSKEILEPLGISALVELPGVGDKYQDHQAVFPAYYTTEESLTLDPITRGDKETIDRWTPQWLENGKGLLASNGLDSGLKIRPTEEEVKAIGPDFEARWKSFFSNAPDKPALYIGSIALNWHNPTIPPRKYFNVMYFLEYPDPTSLGYVHITSGDDVNAAPVFDPAYLSGSGDLDILKWGYKRSREYARRMKCYRGEHPPAHPKFPPHSEGSCKENAEPVPMDTPDIRWTEEDDKLIEDHIRAMVVTTCHSLGTCAMKPREKGGVVDTRLNVYGVEGLKVVDLSIAPGNVSANTCSTVLAIAEKAAVIIGEDLGISDV